MTPIQPEQLVAVHGGQATTPYDLETMCEQGRKNPPPGMTPWQGCLTKVWKHGNDRGFDEGVGAAAPRSPEWSPGPIHGPRR